MQSLLVSTPLVALTSLAPAAQTAGTSVVSTTGKSPTSAASATSSGNAIAGFLTNAQLSDLQASILIGTKVYATGGPPACREIKAAPKARTNIGSVRDLMISQQVQVTAVVIGIGGFLGIGVHRVALELSALKAAPAFETAAENRQKEQATG